MYLGAAMRLTRLWRSQGKPQRARDLTRARVWLLTGAFDTRDLKEAKALLRSWRHNGLLDEHE